MKEKWGNILTTALITVLILAVTGLVRAGPLTMPNMGNGAPTVVSYQGQVILDGTPYDGTGHFKFAVVDAAGTTTYWSNDGSSSGEPGNGVSLTVINGLFNVLLGDDSLENMVPLEADVFDDTEVYLRVWFSNDGGTFVQLSPDLRIAAVPYALQAQEALEASNADTVDGYHGAALEESAEIDADIAGHTTIADAHHARYTDGEAWAAVLANDGPGSGLYADKTPLLDRITAPTSNLLTDVPDTSNDYGTHTSVTIGVDGLGVISYFDEENSLLKVAHCHDTGCSSASRTTLDDAINGVGYGTSITIGVDGLPLISYCDSEGLKVTYCTDIACSPTMNKNINYLDACYGNTSITIGSDGLPLISYYANELTVAHCNDAICADADIYYLDHDSSTNGQYNSITIGVDGMGLISYLDLDWDPARLKVAHCQDVVCSNATLTIIDNTFSAGMYSSVAIGSDGLGLISHYDFDNGRLVVSHCQDTICSDADTYILDYAELNTLAGKYTSVTIGDNGLGLISYYYDHIDSPEGKLKLAHCIDFDCSNAVLTTVDSADGNMVGIYSAVTIGADGLPLISYIVGNDDFTEKNLKIAHCGSEFCTPFFRRR